MMNPYYSYEYDGSYSTEYHPQHLEPYYLEQQIKSAVPSFPMIHEKITIDSSSTECDTQAVMPRTFPLKCQSTLWREHQERQRQLAEKFARKKPMTSTHLNKFCSASKGVKQTSLDDSNITNLSVEHSQSTMAQHANHQVPGNRVGIAQQPIVATPIPLMTVENNGSEDVSALTMAIRKTDCLGEQLSAEDSMEIQMDIHTIIEYQSNNDSSSQFEECNFEDGALIVRCANNATVQWLRTAFDNNGDVFAGLRLVKASELPKMRVAFKTRDILTSDPVVFLKKLQWQNPNLRTENWMTAEGPTMELGLQTQQLFQRWIFKIDQASADAIKAANMTAYTGLFKGNFEFLSGVESLMETVIKQEVEMSSFNNSNNLPSGGTVYPNSVRSYGRIY